MPRFQILSLIGGGIRGSFVTSLLNELEQRLGRSIAESFDLIAGTSTGGIIAAGLALGLSGEQMHDFYVRHGAQIFTPRPPLQGRGALAICLSVCELGIQQKNRRKPGRRIPCPLLPLCVAGRL
jgi:predicted acylesterase/phospholipase RssA